MSATRTSAPSARRCAHCDLPSASGAFCCRGCERAYQLIAEAGLERYYALRDRPTAPVTGELEATPPWAEALAAEIGGAGDLTRQRLSIGGISCAACVWLVERTFRRREGAADIVINPARGDVELVVAPGFDLAGWTAQLAAIGYSLGPERQRDERQERELVRVGIAAAIAVNAMVIAAAVYLGLDTGALHDVFVIASGVLGLAATWIGAGYFGGRAIAALRAGAISFDLPIAAAIVLVFAASAWAAISGRASAIYFDSLCAFVALVLAGRLLADRVLEANRARIAAADDRLGLFARRVAGDQVETVPAADLEPGDVVVIAAGELVPVDAALVDERAGVRLDWITGESEPRLIRAGDPIEAGSINASRRAFCAEVARSQRDGALAPVLSNPEPVGAAHPLLDRRVAPIYLAAVAVAAAAGFALWVGDGASRALEIAAAILVVTCPCALGIGVPLAFELVAGGLRRDGVFVRRAGALDRLARVRQVAFDKTGTLTEGRLAIADRGGIDALDESDRRALFNLAVRSAHPKSRAIADAIDAVFDPDVEVVEIPGAGIAATIGGAHYRLGAAGDRTTAFERDGEEIAALSIAEVVRADAAREIAALEAAGAEVFLVTGDAPGRAAEVAATTAIAPERVVAGARPEDKAAWVAAHDRGDLLFVGDGLNDALALERATASATPASEQPLVANRADFYFTSAGIAPIRAALGAAGRLSRITRAQLGFAIAYNAGAVAVAMAGLMRPWLAAILMPASSIAVVAATAIAATRPGRAA